MLARAYTIGLGIIVILGLGLPIGCGSQHSTTPVTGTVTYKGEPVEGAKVHFGRGTRDIAQGELAIGSTDAQGALN